MPHDERCRDLAAYFLTDGHELAPAAQDDVYSMAEAIQQAIEDWFAAARIRALAAPPAGVGAEITREARPCEGPATDLLEHHRHCGPECWVLRAFGAPAGTGGRR